MATILAIITAGALAQATPDEIVVRADPLALKTLDESRSVYGFDWSYAETPRAISVISDESIARFAIDTVDDLSAFAPGAFTGSFFGVPGSVTLRGARADTFYRGFRRIENPGTFPTPIGASERIEIVRGPTPAQYGPGRVGGFLNITPLTARTERKLARGGAILEAQATLGSFGKRIGELDAGIAGEVNGDDAGAFLHLEYENSDSFYRGISPERFLAQSAVSLSHGDAIDVEIGGAWFSSNGYLQTIGWNRVTQALIDDGLYIAGRDTDLRDVNGDGRLTPDEVDAVVGSFFGASNIRQFIDFGVFPSPAFALDQGVGIARLDPRTVFVSERDIADARTGTLFADVAFRPNDQLTLRIEGFFDSIRSDLHQSYGFAASYDADVFEARTSAVTSFALFGRHGSLLAGASFRRYESRTLQTFLSGYLAVDRRDLTVGPTGDDIFDDPFSTEPGGIPWDTDLTSSTRDFGLFATADLALSARLSATVSLRVDRFTAASINQGATIFDPRLGFARLTGREWTPSFETSLRFLVAEKLIAYATYADNNALETNDGGGVEVERIDQNNFIADSGLMEVGAKLDRANVYASIALYRQERRRQDPFGNLDEETSLGFEAEARILLSDRWSANGALTVQETRIGAPGPCGSGNGEFVVLPPARVGVAPEAGFGGLFAALNASCLPELQDGYRRRTNPAVQASAALTYTAPARDLGVIGATFAGNYVGETGGKIDGAVRLPNYALARAAVFLDAGRFALNGSVENLFNSRYFLPVQNVFEEVGALPGRGREFTLSLKAQF